MLVTLLLICFVIVSMITYALNKTIGFIALQISLAMVIVFSTYATSLWVLKRDKLVLDTRYNVTNNSRTLIIDGFADSSNLRNTVIDTLNPASISYAHLPRSINRYGGAQFTYSFWILLTNTDTDNVGYKDILVRGDTTHYNLLTVVNPADANKNTYKEDIMIKCPRIRFNGTYEKLAVETNTIADPNPPPMTISAIGNTDDTLRKNLLKMTANKWVLYTFVFKDSVQVNDFENGIETRFYLNDIMYQSKTMRSAIRQNNGNLYLFPSGSIDGCKIGNLAYYNYAQSTEEIATVYNKGPPKFASASRSGPVASPLFLSEYNKLDMYNS